MSVYIRKFYFYSVILLFLPLSAHTDDTLFFDEFLDQVVAFADSDDTHYMLSDSELIGRIDQCQLKATCTPFDVLAAILPLGVGSLLQEDLYLHTYPLVVRSLLDNPLFLPYRAYERPHVLGGDFFYNQMTRAHFYKNCSGIASYLAINEPTLLSKLNTIFNLAQEELMLDIPSYLNPLDFLSLFNNFTVQERRAGFMLHGAFFHNNFSLFYNVPFYYLERNFFTTPAEREAIELVLGTAAEEDGQQFAQDHLISDKIGFGDTRFYFGVSPEFLHHFGITAGALITVPTSFLFAKGLQGSAFVQSNKRPDFNLGDIICQFIVGDEQAKICAIEHIQSFGLGALDALSAILLESPLGNYRHVGLGLFMRTHLPLNAIIKRPWTRHFAWKGFLSIEYITPGKERRAFIENCQLVTAIIDHLGLNKTGTELEQYLEQLEQNPVLAQEVLDYINVRTMNIFYPLASDIHVWPGFVFRYTSRLLYEGTRWGFFVGSDLWAQGKEKLTLPCTISEQISPFNNNKAIKPWAYQSKMFGSIFYKVLRDKQDWTLGLSLEDTTMFSSSVGPSFIVSLVFDGTF